MTRRAMLPVAIVAALTLLASPPTEASSVVGAAIYVAGEETHNIDVLDQFGNSKKSFDGAFSENDCLASGDVTGDGVAEIVIFGDESHNADIFSANGVRIRIIPTGYNDSDGCAVGDVNGDGVGEILVAGDETGNVDVFDQFGTLLYSFDAAFNEDDKFAVGNVNGGVADEILVAGNDTGNIDIFNGDGSPLRSFNGAYDDDDGFAVGNIAGDSRAEILVAGDESDNLDVFDEDGNHLYSFHASFGPNDALAAGNVDGVGLDEILVAGDDTNNIDIFRGDGTSLRIIDGDYTDGDGFAVERSGPDTDGDGLLDAWEQNGGVDVDADGTLDVLIPGADPMHKDLFFEFDWFQGAEPRRDQIIAVKEAFAAAPVDAGGIPNPDGLPGINLWVDTGTLIDPNTGMLVGDDLGGGNPLPAPSKPFCTVGEKNFYLAKADNFDPRRALIFRYAVSGRYAPKACGSPDVCIAGPFLGMDCTVDKDCDSLVDKNDKGTCGDPDVCTAGPYIDKDCKVDSDCSCPGGEAERGGNDSIENNHDAGTIMHEWGHTLGLQHGGNEEHNCKPNYVSVMNYNYQKGITLVNGTCLNGVSAGQCMIDYSPARFGGPGSDRAATPLPTLTENDLDENAIVDLSDSMHMMTFKNALGDKVSSPIALKTDYNGNKKFTDSELTVNIDIVSSRCKDVPENKGSDGVLHGGFDDWSNIGLSFRRFGDSADGAIDPVTEPELTLEELDEIQEALNTTDLAIAKHATPDPVVAGTDVTYQLEVVNQGPNTGSSVQIVDVLPNGVSHQSNSAGCTEAPLGTLTCDLGPLPFGGSMQVEIVARVSPEILFEAGGPLTITNTAVVQNLDGPDADSANNSARTETKVIGRGFDIAQLRVRGMRGRPNGLIRLTANFLAVSAEGDEFSAAGGVSVRLLDDFHLDEQHTWTAQQCRVQVDGSARCRSADGAEVSFRPFVPAPELFTMKLRLPKRSPTVPLRAPLRVLLLHEKGIRYGEIDDCRPTVGAGVFCRVP